MTSRSELYNYLKILLREGFLFEDSTQTVKASKKFTDDDIDAITCIVANYFGDKINEFHSPEDLKKHGFKFSSRWINIDEKTLRYGDDGKIYVDTDGLIDRQEVIDSIIESPAFLQRLESTFMRKCIPFIQNTGNEYVDLGITGDEHTKIIVDFMPISSQSGVFSIIGDASEENKGLTISLATKDSYEQNHFGNCSYQVKGLKLGLNYWHTAEISRHGLFLDNRAVFPFHWIDSFETKNLMLFKIPGFDDSKLDGIIRIANVKIWHKEDLMMDLIPDVDGEQPCFIDKISHTFYKAEGGDLIIG